MNDAIESYCPDLLWVLTERLLPAAPRLEQGGGRRRIHPDRVILAAVAYKGKTGSAWADVPRSAFGAPRSTLHERFSTWVRSGFFEALLERLVDKIGPIRARRGRPRCRPDKLHGDNGYDYDDCRAALRSRGIIARKGIESTQRLGRHRWKIERTIAWLDGFRALTIRNERKAAHFGAFVTLGEALTCYKTLAKQANNPIPDVL